MTWTDERVTYARHFGLSLIVGPQGDGFGWTVTGITHGVEVTANSTRPAPSIALAKNAALAAANRLVQMAA